MDNVTRLADYDAVTFKQRDKGEAEQLRELGRRLAELLEERKAAAKAAGERTPMERIAMATGVPVSSIKVYRLGLREPGALALRALALELGTSTDYLLGLTEDRAPPKAATKKKRAG